MSTVRKNDEGKLEEKEESAAAGWVDASHDVPILPNINLERDFIIAKGYLQTIGCRDETVWDHLNDILNHVLKERPEDCMRYFEDLSRELRIKKFFLTKECEGRFKEYKEEPRETDDCRHLLTFYRTVECLYMSETPYEDKFGRMDLLPTFRLLNEAGVGFPFTDIYNIQMGMRYLAKKFPIENMKFWGKIFGTLRDYYVVEAELTTEAMDRRFKRFSDNVEAMKKQKSEKPLIFRENVEEEEEVEKLVPLVWGEDNPEKVVRKLDSYKKPPLPVAEVKEVVVVPSEPPGMGVNRKVYYVANDPFEHWAELPDVTPLQIVKSRQIHRYFTGICTNKVIGFPEFPGTEKELLRAQIARITASTQVSPLGFYTTGGEEEEASVELEEGQLYTENPDFQPLPLKDLLDPTLEFWVHHEPYILLQGRIKYWAPPSDSLDDEGEEESGAPGEKGPQILSSLSGDVMPESTAWVLRKASTLLNEDSVVVLKSNIWPGALTVIKKRFFVNFYLGWGTKCLLKGFNPYYPNRVEKEYEIGPEIMEMDDPTVEMEEEKWMKLHPKKVPKPTGEEEEDEEDKSDAGDDDFV